MNTRLLGAAALVYAAIAAPAAAQTDAQSRAFARDVVAKLQAELPEARFEMNEAEPLEIAIFDTPRFDEGTLNLHRVYAFCQTAPQSECDAQIANFVQAMTEEPPAQGPENLRIIVRDAEYWRGVAENLSERELPEHRQIGEDLYAILAIDSPNAIAIADQAVIAEFGLDREEAWELGAAQTRSMLNPPPDAASLAEAPAAFVADEYMASMIFDVASWESLAAGYGSDLVVAIPSEQIVLFAVIPDGELGAVREFATTECAAASRCVSPNIYRFRDGRWVIAR